MSSRSYDSAGEAHPGIGFGTIAFSSEPAVRLDSRFDDGRPGRGHRRARLARCSRSCFHALGEVTQSLAECAVRNLMA